MRDYAPKKKREAAKNDTGRNVEGSI